MLGATWVWIAVPTQDRNAALISGRPARLGYVYTTGRAGRNPDARAGGVANGIRGSPSPVGITKRQPRAMDNTRPWPDRHIPSEPSGGHAP